MKTNLLLFFCLVACALGLVTAQHYARKNFIGLEQAQTKARQLEVEWDQLQLEQQNLASHGLVSQVAKRDLKMQAVQPNRTMYVAPLDSMDRPVAKGAPVPPATSTPAVGPAVAFKGERQ